MMRSMITLASLVLLGASPVLAYPGGTPDFQTDVAPYCAACHSSASEDALAGAGERAAKETASKKHYAAVAAGQKNYAELSEGDRAKLVEQLQALDTNSTIELEFPPQVKAGQSFQVTAKVKGGAGPVVGVGLVDRAHRWYAKPASSAGWSVVGAPSIIGPSGQPQRDWIDRRPERDGRNITFVNVTGVESDASQGRYASAKIVWTLVAPQKPGDYPLVGVYLYGTEKGTPLGTKTHPVYGKTPLGGFGGNSGRVKFTSPEIIRVK